eukprot:TRINITY_DN17481_c0_g1_i1.p1 TRINITY_DN17481_c0_g1~~TRINITY_DN17481_c0_g1_i1.p1  ORF type:complete len:139 (+),score=21.15 TRINITY_DN17481_c0_g1_i1:194-610(+)
MCIRDRTPLSQVTEVHESFLAGCTGLTTLDLRPLSRVTEVRHSFLAGCSGITALDTSPLWHVGKVHEAFLEGCSGLTALDLTPLLQAVSYTHLRAHETPEHLVCRLLLEKKKEQYYKTRNGNDPVRADSQEYDAERKV